MIISQFDLEEISQGLKKEIHNFSGKTCLVLGHAGFLGQLFKQFVMYVNQEYLEKPIFVICCDNFIGRDKPKNIDDSNFIFLDHDLTVPLGMKLADYKLDYIINFSGNASPNFYRTYGYETLTVSTIATNHLLELAHFHRARILNFSSSELVAHVTEKYIPTDENAPICISTMNHRLIYDAGKVYIEAASWWFKYRYNLDCKVIRPFNVIGPGRNDGRVIPSMLSKALNNQEITVYAPGSQNRSFVYYTDFFVGCLKVLLCDNNELLFNLGNPDNRISMLDLAHKIETLTDKENLVNVIPTPVHYLEEPQNRQPCIEKARKELGYYPKVGLDDALTRIYLWAKDNHNYNY